MKNGFNKTMHPSLIPDQYAMVYTVGMKGITIDPLFQNIWNDLSPEKRGIIHQPVLSVKNGVNENASAFLGLLNELEYGSWNNNIPFILDIWEAPSANQYSLDNIRSHGVYISDHYKPKIKPLLRISVSIWQKWYESNSTETMRILNDYQLLLAQPGVVKPTKLTGVETILWWEWDWGLYSNDPEGLFTDVVNPPLPIDPVDPVIDPIVDPIDPGEQQPPIIGSIPKRWKVSFTIEGTIEAIDTE